MHLRNVKFLVAGLGMLMVVPAFAGGIGGCVNSPENPTAVLGMLGGAVAGYPWLKAKVAERLRRRSPSQD